MGVPQGRTIDEWLHCLESMLKIPEIKVIGLSKLSIPIIMQNELTPARLVLCNLIKRLYNTEKIEWHCLGGSNLILKELIEQETFIRSMDSSAPFWYGWLLRKLDVSGVAHFKTKLDFYKMSPDVSRRETIQYNIQLVLEAAHGNRPKHNRPFYQADQVL
ncbi:hypothetical protein LCGC14_2151410 [marine sediment metagenome]|uniref:Uncharacterized protein n=1 Tax=marine sediment metagenome TaxID=412755 RepID=A0A0F9EHR2_9ZZZZ